MTEDTFKAILKPMQQELKEELPNLNRGGCGRFAYLVGKRLKKNNIPFKIRLILYTEDDFQKRVEALDNIKNNRGLGWKETSFVHCFIELEDGSMFDGHNDRVELLHRYGHYAIVQESEYSLMDVFLALSNGSWNESFRLDRDLPRLVKVVEKHLK